MATLRAGDLTSRITIQEEVRTSDGQGGFAKAWGAPGHTWQAWARKKYLSGGDTSEADQTTSRRRFSYTTRRRKDVTFTAAMRVLDGTMVLDVKGVSLDDDDLSAQTLTCEELPPDTLDDLLVLDGDPSGVLG